MLLTVLALFLINFLFEFATNEVGSDTSSQLQNLSQAIIQFSIIALIPVMTDTFSSDYARKTSIFYFQNNFSPLRLYGARLLVYNAATLLLYLPPVFLYSYVVIDGTSYTLNVIGLSMLCVLCSVNMILFFSMFFKEKWIGITLIIIFWLGAQIINAIDIPYISGFFFPVDGQSNVALYIRSLKGDSIQYFNTFSKLTGFEQALLTCIVWIVFPSGLGALVARSRMMKNAL